MTSGPVYRNFLGTWQLIPESCIYEQGDSPKEGTYRIEEGDGGLVFHMMWTDSAGEEHSFSFTGIADGEQRPFSGGELADALSVTAVSETELNSAAYKAGKELMLATRTLVGDGFYLDVRQMVRLPDLTEPTNFARYKRIVS